MDNATNFYIYKNSHVWLFKYEIYTAPDNVIIYEPLVGKYIEDTATNLMEVICRHLTGIIFVLDRSIDEEIRDRTKIYFPLIKGFTQLQQTNKKTLNMTINLDILCILSSSYLTNLDYNNIQINKVKN
jgi:hypothetical protein